MQTCRVMQELCFPSPLPSPTGRGRNVHRARRATTVFRRPHVLCRGRQEIGAEGETSEIPAISAGFPSPRGEGQGEGKPRDRHATDLRVAGCVKRNGQKRALGAKRQTQDRGLFRARYNRSMSGLIEGAKQKIWSIANEITSAKPTPDIRIGLIGYRDRVTIRDQSSRSD